MIYQWIWGHIQQYSSQKQRHGGYLYGTLCIIKKYINQEFLGVTTSPRLAEIILVYHKQQTWGCFYINQFLGLPVSGDIDQWGW